ncbi:MAG: hypothetical protein QNK37_01745 [Acidobacteriota bacterium]|nr:hypothetical protein [Acidobacteriota bacterium]
MKPGTRLLYWTWCFVYLAYCAQAARFFVPVVDSSDSCAAVCATHVCGCSMDEDNSRVCCCGPVSVSHEGEDHPRGESLVMCGDPAVPFTAPSPPAPHVPPLFDDFGDTHLPFRFDPPENLKAPPGCYGALEKVPIGLQAPNLT